MAQPSRKRALLTLGLGGVLVLGGVGGVVLTQREGLRIRVEQARQELAAAAAGDLDTPTGARVAVMAFALESGLRRPWGLGAGGIGGGEEGNSHLPPATSHESQMANGKSQVASGSSLPHAHSAPLHLFGTLGWIGLGLGGLWAWVALRNAGGGHGAEQDPAEGTLGTGLLGGLSLGIAGLLLAGLFDAVQINTQTCALLGAMAALSPAVGRHSVPTLGGPARRAGSSEKRGA